MPAYNFQPRFVPRIVEGTKLTTIRSKPAKVGSMAYLFTGMRTKACRRLGQSEIFDCKPIVVGYKDNGEARIKLGGKQQTTEQANILAVMDGFDSAREMVKWFEATYKVPANNSGCARDVFSGYLIEWGGL